MLPRSQRLARDHFPIVAKGRRQGSEHFSASFSGITSGYAVIVSKSVAKSSVVRHKLKRRVMEVLAHTPSLPQALIIYAKKGAPTLSFADIEKEIRDILKAIR